MELNLEEVAQDVVCVGLNGRLDTPGVDQVETRFNAATVATSRHALIDLASVSFVSSMGIRMLISAARALQQRGRKLVLFGAAPLVAETFDNAGIDQLILLAPDRESALNALTLA